jgi:hypothetical protein
MFGTVVDKLQALLSRKFLFAVYFPMLIFTTACFVMSCFVFTSAADALWSWWGAALTTKVQHLVIVMLAVAVVAYTFTPLALVCRRALEADLKILSPISVWLRQSELALAAHKAATSRESLTHTIKVDRETTGLLNKLLQARLEGVAAAVSRNPAVVELAGDRVNEVSQQRRRNERNPGQALDDLLTSGHVLEQALKENNASDQSNYKLQEAYGRLRDECLEMQEAARQSAARDAEDLYSRFPRRNIRTTKFANISASIQEYAVRTYGVEYEYLWPRLQFVLAKDDKSNDIVDAAQNQLDYSILLLGLTTIFFMVWIPTTCFIAPGMMMFLIIGFAAPSVIALLYLMVIENLLTLGSVVRATVDRFRIDVLTSLSQPPPFTLTQERQRWHDVQAVIAGEGIIDISLSVNSK